MTTTKRRPSRALFPKGSRASASPAPPISKHVFQQAKALRRSEITHFRWSPAFGCLVHPMQASSRWDLTRGDHCSRLHARATDFHFRKRGILLPVYRFFFDLGGGSQGISPFDLRHHRQTGFGHARGERGRPQFKAHNSVRSLKNGLSLGGSSATRPTTTGGPREYFEAVFSADHHGRAA